MPRTTPLLARDDPEKGLPAGHIKVTREDWLNMARDVLINDGVAEVKVLTLSRRLGVSRSSFYWYFGGRRELLAALLDEWEARNTATIVAHCDRPSENITEAVCNFFRCFVDTAQFDPGLDFAVREWSRRDDELRLRVESADARRVEAAANMFLLHGYAEADADARGRILYFMQLGYHALEVREDMALRLSRVPHYLPGFTGQPADPRALDKFRDFVAGLT